MIRKILAVFIIIALLVTIFKDYMWWIIGFFILLILIRLGADIFWFYNDKNKW